MLERICWNENMSQRSCPPGPRLSSPGERERHTAMPSGAREVNMLQSLFSLQLPLTHNFSNKVKVKLATIVEGDQKAPFSIATTPRCRGGRYSFPGLLYFTLDPHLIMLSVKQGGIKYHFESLV